MQYIVSSLEDAKLHKRFHDGRVGGLDVPRTLMSNARVVTKCERCIPMLRRSMASKKLRDSGDEIVEIGRRDALVARNTAVKVLEVVEEELGAVRTTEDDLWGQLVLKGTNQRLDAKPKSPSHEAQDELSTLGKAGLIPKHDRHKVYLYIQDSKCLGLCLCERIEQARPILSATGTEQAVVELGDERKPADLGISRIWVATEFRRSSIARQLLDTARRNFLGGIEVLQDQVAFSQPTTSGAKLARSWFGKEDGWLVYVEET